MKKEYQSPQSEIASLKIGSLLNDTSPEPIPIGEGDPDSRRSNGDWDYEPNNSRRRTVWDDEEEEL